MSARPTIPGGGPQSVADVLDVGLRERPHAEALVSRHRRLTFEELDDLTARAATQLAELGVRPGDRVGASAGNHAELVVAFLATQRLEAVWVGINQQLAAPEIEFILDDAGITAFLGDAGTVARAAALRPDLTVLDITADGRPDDWFTSLGGHDRLRPAPVDPHAPAAIGYTSGTTGQPKGAVHSQHNLLLPGASAALLRPDRPDARPGVCLPLTILNLVVLGPLVSFQQALPCVLMDRVDAVGIAGWIRDERLTTFAAVPAMVHDLLTHPDVHDSDLVTLVRPGVGGADCPQAVHDLYRARFGTRITTGYGLTEAPTAVTGEDPAEPGVPGSVGRPLPHVDITIRDDDGAVLPAGAEGEVCVGPAADGPLAGAYTPMLGYWDRPEATDAAFWEGGTVLRTGDIGRFDDDGHLFITARKHDLIIRGGANVYPAEVERVLAEVPGVAACCVVGVPDERLGERVAAAVVVEPGAAVDAERLTEACASSLARYKVPSRFEFVDALPRNAMGKVVRREVQALL